MTMQRLLLALLLIAATAPALAQGWNPGSGPGSAWTGAVIAGQYGGTGVANTDKTITLGGNLVTSGAFATTLTATATTGVTLPTTGTLATLAGIETLTNKTLSSGTLTGITTLTANATIPAIGATFTDTVDHLVGANATGFRSLYDTFGGIPSVTGRRAEGTVALPSAVTADLTLFNFGAAGYGATGYSGTRGLVAILSAATWTDISQPTYISGSTTPVDSTTRAEAWRATDAGNFILPRGGLTVASTTLLTSSVALADGAAAASGTLTNAPAAGNPTKWIPINDNGTTRYLPAW